MKTKRIKSALPIYGAAIVWLLMGLIAPKALLHFGTLLLTAAISAGAYFGLSQVFKGRVVETREAAHSGNSEVDALIETARGQLDSIKAANAAIPDADITENLNHIEASGEQILLALERNTSQAGAVRRFLNYYLPTTDKLMSTYRMLAQTGSKTENITHSMDSVRNSLGMIREAFEKQLDRLYKDRALDIDTDIDVLEMMMSGDGLLKGNMNKNNKPLETQTTEEAGQVQTMN